MDFDITDAASALDAAWQSYERKIEAGRVTARVLEVRDGAGKKLIYRKPYVDNWRERPERVVGTANVQSPESFIGLVNRHCTTERSALFSDAMNQQPSIQAVIDYHGGDADPDWCKHRIRYGFPLSREWNFWMAVAAKGRMDQSDFANLIEERIADVVTGDQPEEIELASQMGVLIATPARLLTFSRGLQVRVSQIVKESRNLASGADQIVFEETHEGENGEPLVVPGLFVLSIPVFQGDAPIRLPVRLRYRVLERKTFWIVVPYRADKVLVDTVKAVAERAAHETMLPLFYGSPEA